jgi:hypothetical protein
MNSISNSNIPILSVEEIVKIDISIERDDLDTIKDLLSQIDTNFLYKSLLLCAFIMDVNPNEVLIKNAGRKSKLSPTVFIARYMWFTVIYHQLCITVKEASLKCGFNKPLYEKGLKFFEEKRKKSAVLNMKYNTVLSILNQEK